MRLIEPQEVASRTSAKSSAGIADTSDISRTLNLQRSSLIDRGLLDPSDATKMAQANTVLAKSFEQMSAAAETARAPLEGLKKLELELQQRPQPVRQHRDVIAQQPDDKPGGHHDGLEKGRRAFHNLARRSCARSRRC